VIGGGEIGGQLVDLGIDGLADGPGEILDRGILLRRQGCGRHGRTPVPGSSFSQPSPFSRFCTKIPPTSEQPSASPANSRIHLTAKSGLLANKHSSTICHCSPVSSTDGPIASPSMSVKCHSFLTRRRTMRWTIASLTHASLLPVVPA